MSLARRALKSPFVFIIAAAGGACLAAAFGGGIAAWAFLLGVAGTGFNILAMRWVIGLAADYAKSPEASPKPTKMTLLVVFAFFVKLPILVGLGAYVQSLGNVALPSFLWGLGLVYFALVGWATATS